ncbi:MAG: DUF4870 domain-containing protein [Andreesenia angusta]|nr:DUF4870 domain-containing protein [Andreesenia angusta]
MESGTESTEIQKVKTPYIDSNDRLIALVMYILSLFFPIIAPLIIWLIKKDESPFLDYHGKEYFNFLLSVIIYSIISVVLIIFFVGIFLIYIVGIYSLIATIVAAIKAYNGEYYRIPFTIRIIQN